MAEFVHLHVHSHYSLLDGLGKIDQLISRAKELGMPALALTDHGAMYGAIEFYQKAKEAGIKPIIGVETYLSPRKMTDKEPKIDTYPYHLILLCKNEIGYKNLMKLVTLAHLEGYYYKPRIDKETLKKYSEGLIATSACLQGEIPRHIAGGNIDAAKQVLKEYLDIFGKENFYLEIQSRPQLLEQEKVNRALIEISQKTGVGLVATNDIHYINPDDKEAHEVLLAVQTGKNVDEKERLSLKEVDLWLASQKEMTEKFKDVPGALDNTLKIAQMSNLEVELGKPILPEFKLPGRDRLIHYIQRLCREGLNLKYPKNRKEAEQRLEYELSVIEKTGFADYFLIVSDFVNFAKEKGIIVGPGRGSAAGSIVSYLLGITDVDPIKYNLLFERFLNPERIAPPDIDLDFQDDRRDEVIDYISQKYGRDHVAQIITFGTMASRGSVRDVGRALGMSYGDVDKIAKLIPFGMTLDQTLNTVSELLEQYNKNSQVKKLIDMAKKLEGVVRHASTHAAGVVISREPLVNYTPLQHSTRGTSEDEEAPITTQYSMYDVEAIGLLKMDILGLANLTIIKNTLRILRKTRGIEVDFKKIPLNDKKTYELLAKAETTGVFQLESDGMKRYLKDLRPTEFEDIVAMISLYRPGPMELIPDYIKGKHGRRQVTYLHPKLQPILESTYGVAVYQEQLMKIAQEIAGYTLAEADILRKAVGKKIKKLLLQQERKFVEGAVKNGVKREIAQKLFRFIEPFARYGFNRSHGVAYAQIAYQTAYLKAHHPAEFLAALLTSEQNNLDKVAVAISEAERIKIKVLPPEINESFVEFGVDSSGNIRYALAAIKNVGQGVAEKIVEERKSHGYYQGLEDFSKRLGTLILNKKVVESLAKSGALDNFAERNAILAGVEEVLKFAGRSGQKKDSSQIGLFGSSALEQTQSKLQLPQVDPASKKQRLSWEREFLGIYLSEHPLKEVNHLIEKEASPISGLNGGLSGKKIKVAGIITSVQKIVTKSAEPMLFVRLEDLTSNTEILVFPKVLKQDSLVWQPDNIILVEGRVSTKDGTVKILADSARELGHQEAFREKKVLVEKESGTNLHLTLSKSASKETLEKLKNILTAFRGESKVILHLPRGDKYQLVETGTKVEVDENLSKKLQEVDGVEKVEIG